MTRALLVMLLVALSAPLAAQVPIPNQRNEDREVRMWVLSQALFYGWVRDWPPSTAWEDREETLEEKLARIKAIAAELEAWVDHRE